MLTDKKVFEEKTFSERLYIANNIYIMYPRFKEILSAIDDCHHCRILKMSQNVYF